MNRLCLMLRETLSSTISKLSSNSSSQACARKSNLSPGSPTPPWSIDAPAPSDRSVNCQPSASLRSQTRLRSICLMTTATPASASPSRLPSQVRVADHALAPAPRSLTGARLIALRSCVTPMTAIVQLPATSRSRELSLSLGSSLTLRRRPSSISSHYKATSTPTRPRIWPISTG